MHTHAAVGSFADEAVRALTISALPILAVLTVFDGFNAVVSGVLRYAPSLPISTPP